MLKLTYFDFHGGRGEPARLALSMGGIAFEDDRVPVSDWERRKPDTPFGALPSLEKDGQIVAQSNAINREHVPAVLLAGRGINWCRGLHMCDTIGGCQNDTGVDPVATRHGMGPENAERLY